MEAHATARYISGSPQKIRLVVNLIRGRNVSEAINLLRFTKKRAAAQVAKVLKSAIANAEQRDDATDVDQLFVSKIYVNEGPRLKRLRPAPMGRAFRFQRRMSHISVHVSDK